MKKSFCVLLLCVALMFTGCGGAKNEKRDLEKILRDAKFEQLEEPDKTFGEIMDDFIEASYCEADDECLWSMKFTCNEDIDCLKYDEVKPRYDSEKEDLICMTLTSVVDERIYKLTQGAVGNNNDFVMNYIFSVDKESDKVTALMSIDVMNGTVSRITPKKEDYGKIDTEAVVLGKLEALMPYLLENVEYYKELVENISA